MRALRSPERRFDRGLSTVQQRLPDPRRVLSILSDRRRTSAGGIRLVEAQARCVLMQTAPLSFPDLFTTDALREAGFTPDPATGYLWWRRAPDQSVLCIFPDQQILMGFDQVRDTSDGVRAEVAVEYRRSGRDPLAWGNVTLASVNQRDAVVQKLEARTKDVTNGPNWADLLQKACRAVVLDRRSIPDAVLMTPRRRQGTLSLIPPSSLVVKGHANVIGAPSAHGKSMVALMLSLGISSGADLSGIGTCPTPGPVLYLEAEGQLLEDHEDRLDGLMRGLRIEDAGPLYFRKLAGRSFLESLPTIAADVRRMGITFLVLDSHAYAAMNPAMREWHERAVSLYAGLDSLGITSLTLAHVPTDGERLFGGVFVKNGARNVWMLQRSEDDKITGDLTVTATNDKATFGATARPLTLRFSFLPDGRIVPTAQDLIDVPDLLDKASLTFRLLALLKLGALHDKAIYERLSTEKPDSIRKALDRMLKPTKRGTARLTRLPDGRVALRARQEAP